MLDQLYPIKTHTQLIAGIILLMAFMTGCTASKPFQVEEKPKIEKPKEKKLLLSEYEATLNPVEFDREIEIVQKVRSSEQKQQNPLEIPKDSMIVQEEVVQGYRIQIFSSSNVDETILMKNLAVEKFVGDSIYVVYDAPVYKVRIGDFINRYEANQRLPEFVEKGYRDAWIVPDRIVQRTLVRVSISK
ncbi:MAG: SPOR domain-containing protein [Ignavibacteriales bacterium]|nr:SPOR domain-containing protein [Ignavibacteriales bacterium]